jgi:hypothetical protein
VSEKENLILIKVHDYIDNYSGEITESEHAGAKINKLNFRCPDMKRRAGGGEKFKYLVNTLHKSKEKTFFVTSKQSPAFALAGKRKPSRL